MERLSRLGSVSEHEFAKPVKKINDGSDLSFFLTSQAYTKLMRFLMHLNGSVYPRTTSSGSVQVWDVRSKDIPVSTTASSVISVLEKYDGYIAEAPPASGPRRFGNVSFRKWFELVEERSLELFKEYLSFIPETVSGLEIGPTEELLAYLTGSFGSAQRLDYGTGHELSFLAFIGGLWQLGGFNSGDELSEERAIVLTVIDKYLALIRKLIITYNLEPAGSHGVWGLDDHSFLPYIFGSAQLCPPVSADDSSVNPEEQALRGEQRTGAPDPGSIVNKAVVERERKTNMYFGAIGFINDVKTGPFWEHSPTLYDISGARGGWAKINKGMIKMYNAEVLSKFPVVQHFPFGSLYPWERDPDAKPQSVSVHNAAQPLRNAPAAPTQLPPVGPIPSTGTAAPWASTGRPVGGLPPARFPGSSASSQPVLPQRFPTDQKPDPMPPTRAPWAKPPGP